MLEMIERILRAVSKMLQRQAEKDAKVIAYDERRVEELRQEIQERYAHRAKCNSLSKRIQQLSEEL